MQGKRCAIEWGSTRTLSTTFIPITSYTTNCYGIETNNSLYIKWAAKPVVPQPLWHAQMSMKTREHSYVAPLGTFLWCHLLPIPFAPYFHTRFLMQKGCPLGCPTAPCARGNALLKSRMKPYTLPWVYAPIPITYICNFYFMNARCNKGNKRRTSNSSDSPRTRVRRPNCVGTHTNTLETR